MSGCLRLALWLSASLVVSAPRLEAQRSEGRDTSRAMGITAGEADAEPARRQLVNALRLDLGFTTFQLGGGILVDFIGYDQDSASRETFDLVSIGKIRDARFLTGGRFATRRPFTWQMGLMYDVPNKKWLFRQTGVMIAVPEIWSHFFIGRAKEGFSMNKVMVGYDGWSMERLPFTDATVPLLADGLKWLGSTPNGRWFWNLGLFTDWQSEGQTFSTYNNQVVLRTGWVPLLSDSAGTLLHVAMNFRAGDVNNDTLQLRSRPEAFPAPYFIDTGKMPAQSAAEIGPELYFRPGRLLIGGEYYWQTVTSAEMDNPRFHGGEAVIAWLTTGETRSFNTVGYHFRPVSPRSTVIEGGPGAWEVVLKYSYSNLRYRAIDGGVLSRVTPMLNWHMTDNVRLEFAVGIATLSRSGTRSTTEFFQSRMQFKL
jgi:phosphate-selective porin OprO/OprP